MHSSEHRPTTGLTRRSFLLSMTLSAAGLAVGARATGVSAATPLPRSIHPAPLAQEDVLTAAGRAPGELSSLITATDAFYTVSKNPLGGDPALDSTSWRLIVDGQVNSPVQLDYAILQQLPPVEIAKTLECISNFTAQCELASFGCDLISTAIWRGARLSDVLDLAGGLRSDAVSIAAISADEFSSGIPAEAVMDPETLVVYAMNGVPLPRKHGFPARLLIPGRYGMKNAKWIVQLSAMSEQHVDWYGQRGWNRQGIVKTMSRIDTPATFTEIPAGQQTIAGIAYGGARGISAVEYSADRGASWQSASFIEPQPGRDSWVRWQGSFVIGSGEVRDLICRAYDGTGALQTEVFSLPEPDGGSGWHSITVKGA